MYIILSLKKLYMKYLLLLITSLISLQVSGQNFIDNHYSALEDLERSRVVHVSGRTFDIASQVVSDDDEDAADVKAFLASIHSVDVVSVPEYTTSKSDYKEALGFLESDFEELMNYKESGSRFSLHINADGDVVYEVVGVGYDEENEFVLISVTGEMDLSMISKVIESFPADDVAVVRDFKKADGKDFRVYPNPVVSGGAITVDIPEGFRGGNASIYDVSGARVRSFTINDRTQSINASDISAGTYSVVIEKNGLSIKKRLIVVK